MIFDRPARPIDERLQRLRAHLDKVRDALSDAATEAESVLLDAEIAVQKLQGDQRDYERLHMKEVHGCGDAWCSECDGPRP